MQISEASRVFRNSNMDVRNGNGEMLSPSDKEDLAAPSSAASAYKPWQTLSALAGVTNQAVQETFATSIVNDIGHVEQSLQRHTTPTTPLKHSAESAVLPDTGQVDVSKRKSPTGTCSHVDSEAAQADIRRVGRKMLSTDAATQVILRFNFLSGAESRVRTFAHVVISKTGGEFALAVQASLLLVAASIIVGGGVLITEFTHKMRGVSPYLHEGYKHAANMVWQAAKSNIRQLVVTSTVVLSCRAIRHRYPTRERPHTSGI